MQLTIVKVAEHAAVHEDIVSAAADDVPSAAGEERDAKRRRTGAMRSAGVVVLSDPCEARLEPGTKHPLRNQTTARHLSSLEKKTPKQRPWRKPADRTSEAPRGSHFVPSS